MRAIRAIGVLCCLSLAGIVWAEPTFPALTGRVVDTANVFDTGSLSELSAQLEAHEAETSNQIVVATVPSLQGYDIADFGVRLASHWKIGTAEDDNGVVLLVAPTERKVRIDVGYGLEGALPDALAGDIIRKHILPSFREGDYAAGVSKGVNSIIQAIKGEYVFDASRASRNEENRIGPLVPVAFMVIILIAQFLKKRFKNNRVSQAIVPAGFFGLVGFAMSNNLFIAIALLVAVFALISLTSKRFGRSSNSRNSSTRNNHRHGGFGGSSGGGFSGGGGGFGGGGASGGW